MSGTDDGEADTAIALALKRAAATKLRKKLAKREDRDAKKQARLDRLKVKAPDPQDHPPSPIAAPQTGASLQVSAQHFLQDKAAREQRIRQLASIALGRASEPEPVVIERLPPPPPSGPDDPRVRNGSLAPSPKVAAMLKTTVSEAAAETGNPKRVERTGHPEGWLEVLRSGSPEAILATRPFKDLKGDDLEAFSRARQREFEALLGGRRFKDLSEDERPAYWAIKVRHLNLMSDPTAPRRRRKGAARGRVGKRLDVLRHEAGLTLRQTAEQTGVAHDRLCKIAAGKVTATEVEAATLGRFFNVNPEKFMSPATNTPDAKPASRASTLNGITPPKDKPMRPGYSEEYERRRLAEVTEPRDTDTYFQATLRRIMRERGLMGEPLAKLCGLSRDVPNRLLRVGSKPNTTTRQKLVVGLQVSEEELFGTEAAQAAPEALQEPPEAIQAAPAPEVVVEADTDEGAVLASPMVPVEMGIPMPLIVLRSDRYPWDMPKGGSFKAEVPFGMPWPTFRSRFLKMIDRQSDALGHWYTFEENEAVGTIRVWRII